jgi:hypothetical protein
MESLDLAVPSGLTTKMAEIESWFTNMSLELTSQRFAVHGQCACLDTLDNQAWILLGSRKPEATRTRKA